MSEEQWTEDILIQIWRPTGTGCHSEARRGGGGEGEAGLLAADSTARVKRDRAGATLRVTLIFIAHQMPATTIVLQTKLREVTPESVEKSPTGMTNSPVRFNFTRSPPLNTPQ